MDELCASLSSTPDEILFVWRFTVSDQIFIITMLSFYNFVMNADSQNDSMGCTNMA